MVESNWHAENCLWRATNDCQAASPVDNIVSGSQNVHQGSADGRNDASGQKY